MKTQRNYSNSFFTGLLFLFLFSFLTFNACKSGNDTGQGEINANGTIDSKTGETVKYEKADVTGFWILDTFNTFEFLRGKDFEKDQLEQLNGALRAMIGEAFYHLNEDGSYQAGTEESLSIGSWKLNQPKSLLILSQDTTGGIRSKPVYFRIQEARNSRLTLVDQDSLWVTFRLRKD